MTAKIVKPNSVPCALIDVCVIKVAVCSVSCVASNVFEFDFITKQDWHVLMLVEIFAAV